MIAIDGKTSRRSYQKKGAKAAHGVDGDDGAFDCHHGEEFGYGDDLIGFFRHLDLPEHKALACREG